MVKLKGQILYRQLHIAPCIEFLRERKVHNGGLACTWLPAGSI